MDAASPNRLPSTGFSARTIWRDADGVGILDQSRLPYEETHRHLADLESVAAAIRSMQVRGAPLIGATAAFGVAIAMASDASDDALDRAVEVLGATRPTAVNLHWALARMARRLRPLAAGHRASAAWAEADAIAAEDAALCAAIGEHGRGLLTALAEAHGGPVRVLTHCNAGWLATCGIGTALAPVYAAHDHGVPVEVVVSETRPRNQGLLTAWELRAAGVPHTLVADNAAGHLLANGQVDVVITGADRIAANGDAANKVGTMLKALAARDAAVPFYVAAPSSTIDLACPDGSGIPIEDRGADEVCTIRGLDPSGRVVEVRLAPPGTRVANPAFDVTPARLITGFVTERGVVEPAGLAAVFGRSAE
jgi:methylthioribose-1-phosphate isomerase